MDTKRCSRCGKMKAAREFYTDRRSTDGLRSDCRDCVRDLIAWRKEHPGEPTPYQQKRAKLAAELARRCPKCGEVKPIEAFGTDRARPDGRDVRCKECRREATREARQTD